MKNMGKLFWQILALSRRVDETEKLAEDKSLNRSELDHEPQEMRIWAPRLEADEHRRSWRGLRGTIWRARDE